MTATKDKADDQCPICEARCKHGRCDCDQEACPDCMERWNLEREAEAEANWQRNVIGPMFGFDKEDKA